MWKWFLVKSKAAPILSELLTVISYQSAENMVEARIRALDLMLCLVDRKFVDGKNILKEK